MQKYVILFGPANVSVVECVNRVSHVQLCCEGPEHIVNAPIFYRRSDGALEMVSLPSCGCTSMTLSSSTGPSENRGLLDRVVKPPDLRGELVGETGSSSSMS